MQSQLAVHLQQMGLAKSITVEYLYLPPYSPRHAKRVKRASASGHSPCLNLVEYVIHLARLKFLHHLPMETTLEQIEREARWSFPSLCNHVVEHQLFQFLDSNQFLSAQQVQNTLNFIFSLVA